MNWQEVVNIATGGLIVVFVGWIGKFMRSVDNRLIRIETKLKIKNNGDD